MNGLKEGSIVEQDAVQSEHFEILWKRGMFGVGVPVGCLGMNVRGSGTVVVLVLGGFDQPSFRGKIAQCLQNL